MPANLCRTHHLKTNSDKRTLLELREREEITMAFCINCGSELPDGAKFCISCGTPNAAPALAPSPEPAPVPVEQPAEQPVPEQAAPQSQAAPKVVKRSVQGGGFGKIMMIIVGALIALTIILGLIAIIKNAVGGSSGSLEGAGSGTALTEILDKTAATHYGGGTSKPSDSSTSSDDGEDFRGDHEESFDGEESADTEDAGKGDDIAGETAGGSTNFEILPWGKKEGGVEFTVDIPAGWSWREDYSWIVEDNENAVVTGLPFIEFKVEKSLDKFDKYKDSFENLKDIDDRVIGGVTMKGRTYKNCGYDKTQYLAQIDDERAVSIVIVKCDLSDGSVASGILDSIKMQ